MHPISFRNLVQSMYDGHEAAHGWSHILAVEGAAKFLLNHLMDEHTAQRMWEEEGLQEAVLLHDVGRALPGDDHESSGAALIEANPRIMNHLEERASSVLAAVRYHRASIPYQGGDLLVKILRDADRLSAFLGKDPNATMARAIAYGKAHHPELSEEEHVTRAREHQMRKYGPGGYAMTGIHFPITREYIEETVNRL